MRVVDVRVLCYSFIAFFAAMCSPAHADLQTIHGSDNSVWGSVGGSFLNYKEESPPPYLPDSEHGILPSLAGGFTLMGSGDARDLSRNLYFAVEGAANFGGAHYNGAYFAAPTTPLEGTTNETIWSIDGKLGRGFPVNRYTMLIPYVELGYRYWDRDFGGGQVEDYQNADTLGGMMVQVSPTRRLILSAYGSAGATWGAVMSTGDTNYTLGSAGVYKLGGKVGYDLTQRFELFTTLDYDYFRYGQSAVQADDTYEPNSHTEETTMRVGLGYHFM